MCVNCRIYWVHNGAPYPEIGIKKIWYLKPIVYFCGNNNYLEIHQNLNQ